MQSSGENTSRMSLIHQRTAFKDSGIHGYYDFQAERTAIKIVTGILSLIGLYAALSQAYFFIAVHIISKKKSRSRDYARSLNFLCSQAAFATFLRIGVPIDDIIGYDTKTKCIIIIEYKIVTFGLALATLYTILWFRQRAFYSSPALKDLSTPFIRCCSLVTPFIIWPGCVATILLVSFSEGYYDTEFGCAITRKEMNTFAWAFRGVAFAVMQCNLLSLFIYPLIRHREAMRNVMDRPTDALDVLIKRAVLTTVTCICMDTMTSLFGLFYHRDLAIVHHFIYDINILVNLLAIMLSFNNWPDRLYPWRIAKGGRTNDLDSGTNENRTASAAL